jgi:vacuolar-type H+-ATPase subunit D/Vma8
MSEKSESYEELLKLKQELLIKERQEVNKEIAQLEKEIYGFDLSLLDPPNTERN